MTDFELTEELAYVTGFLIGDGNLSQKYLVRAVEENEEFIQKFSGFFSAAFGAAPKIYFDRFNNSYVAYVHSKKIWEYLVNVLNIPKGTKSRIVRIPEKIKESDDKIKAATLSGLFDAEGSVIKMQDPKHHPRGYLKIQLKIHNKGLAADIHEMLIQLGFKARIYNYNDFAMVNIHGKSQGELFLEKIGFKHPIKNAKLAAFSPTK